MKKNFAQLEKLAIFSGIDHDDMDSMLTCLQGKVVSYKKGSTIFFEGDPANLVGVLLSGKAHIIKEDYYGNRNLVAEVSPCELFGEVFACANLDSIPVSVIAMEKSEVLFMDCKRILTTCANGCKFHNRLISNLLQIVARKTLILNQKIDFISKRSTQEKLMSYLLSQAKQANSSEFVIPFNRQELADFLYVERSAMSAQLSRMRQEGLIEYDRNWFKLL